MVLMLLLISCKSTQIKNDDVPHLQWMSAPSVYDPEGNPLVEYNSVTHEVSMNENKWFEIVEYIVITEENKKALEVYFDYE